MECLASVGLKGDALKGKHAVVVGASDTVGKPIAAMLMRPEATVTSCNVHTADTPGLCRAADIVVACAGVAHLVKANWVRGGAVVIDVGIHRVPVQGDATGVKLRTVGDVEPEGVGAALGGDGWLSPVPGGVGPVTVAMLLGNVVSAAEAASTEIDE
jgi:methylenetetrahydrofolate dehydrogenase (NADP+)/methenyltetrahydrofolate cyclohydrolase